LKVVSAMGLMAFVIIIFNPLSYAQTGGIGQVKQFEKLREQQAGDTRFADLFAEIQKSPRNPQTHLALAQTYLEKGLLELALESFHRVLKLDSKMAVAHFGLSKVYRKKKIKTLEVSELEAAVAQAPGHDQYLYELGVLYMEPDTFDYKKAKKQYKALKKMESPLAAKLAQLLEID
jgi:cytochrome c-type biogenesis protein CcmH/NrfG